MSGGCGAIDRFAGTGAGVPGRARGTGGTGPAPARGTMGGMPRPRSPRPRTASRETAAGCPCGTAAPYDDCCGRLHRGAARAGSPQELMRSRYSAFAVGDEAYLLRTWHPDTRPAAGILDAGTRWLRLDVLATTGGGPFHAEGTVEFRAHYRAGGRAGSLHENSRFTHHEGAWVYLDGAVTE